MNTHSIDLIRYRAQSRGNSTIYLGTAGSHGNEQLQVTQGKGWEGLTVQVVFHPCKVAVQLPANGVLDVPWEATAQPLTALQGRIVFQGFDQDRLVNSTDLAYTVASHSPALGRDEQPYTPGIVEGVLNQMAADKDAILQAAQQTGQAKEAAAASAAAAASSAANAQQSAGAANTSVGQAAASASQAAASAAAANETLTQVQTAGQEAQQKVKDAETEALGNISAAAPALPAVSSAAAWQSVTAKPDGTGYNLAAMAPIEATIRPTVTGNPAVCEDSTAWAFQGLKIYGKSTQDGTPSPENPVSIVSAGESGGVEIAVTGKNLLNMSRCSAFAKNYGLTPVIDGDSVLISGTATATMSIATFAILTTNDEFLVGKNFKFSWFTDQAITSISGLGTNNKINLAMSLQEGQSYNFAIKISVWLEKLDAWEPYTGQSLPLSTPSGLPGIPVTSGGNFTDVGGQRLVCDVKDYVTREYTQNCYGVVFDGSEDETWEAQRTILGNRYFLTLPIGCLDSASENVNSLNSVLKLGASGSTYSIPYVYTIIGNKIYVSLSGSETLAEFRDFLSMHPMQLLAVMTTPIVAPIPAEELSAYRALTTYDGTTVVSTAEPVAGIEARYVMDGNKYRESVDKRLAALEAAQTGI